MIRLYDHNVWGNHVHVPIGNRHQLIRRMIDQYQPDFCTVQECSVKVSRQGDQALPRVLADTYEEAAAEAANRNHTPLFYHRERFTLVEDGFVPFPAICEEVFDTTKSLTWAVLEHKATGKRIGVVSTHFWFKQRLPRDNEQRLNNAAQVKTVCDDIVARYNVPVLVSGDFNCGVTAPLGDEPYRWLVSQGFQDVRHLAEITCDTKTCRHEYPVQDEQGNFHGHLPIDTTIDYMLLYNGGSLKVKAFDVLTCQDALDSSDHCPLIGDFEW